MRVHLLALVGTFAAIGEMPAAKPEQQVNALPDSPLSASQMPVIPLQPNFDSPPKFLSGTAPKNPITLSGPREAGYAIIRFTVDESGRTRDFGVVKTNHQHFADEAIVAIKDWRFEPAMRKGRPARFQTQTTLSYAKSDKTIQPVYEGIPANPHHYYYRVSPSNAPLKTEEAIYSPHPEWPIIAKQRHLTGHGLFAIHIAADGRVERVTILKSTCHAELDQGSIQSFREWRFRPHSISLVRVPIAYVFAPRSLHVTPLPMKNLGDGVDITIGYDPV